MTRLVILAALLVAAHAETILQIAQSLPQFSTLVAVAGQAGIAPLLSAPGDKTVFAPTNDAFGLLGNNTLGWITNEHNQQHLLSTLYYHITAGSWTTADFKPPQYINTLDSTYGRPEQAVVVKNSKGYVINNALVTTADVAASNGVIQVIDRVLVPTNIDFPQRDIVHTAIETPILSTLVKAVTAAGLAGALSQPNGPYVVFAPTDAAFAAVPSKVLSCLLSNPKALAEVLLFHVASGYVYSEQVASGASITTLAGKPISFSVKGGSISISYGSGFPASNVILANVDTSNGVVHVIDRVLFDNTGPCAAL
jgi:uncharacterized surface protein with fasciclin (FAS1) repeats